MVWNVPTKLESAVQRAVVEYARSKGATAIKIAVQGGMGVAGYPDYIFLKVRDSHKGFGILFIEFKKPGGRKPEKHQEDRIKLLRSKGFMVEVVAHADYGKMEIDIWLLSL